MNFRVSEDGKVFAPCIGCGQEIELKEFPAGEATCQNDNCKAVFPYSVPPGIGPEKSQNNSAKKKSRPLWTKEDDNFLIAAIARGGMKEAIKVFDHKFCPATIYNRADRLGLKFENANIKWSVKEFQILRKLYPKGGSAMVFKALGGKYPQRSIRWKASKSGISMHARNFWTEEDDDLLRKTYPQGGVGSAFQVLGKRHTKGGIFSRVGRLGIRRNSNKIISESPDSKGDFSIKVKPGQIITLHIKILPEVA